MTPYHPLAVIKILNFISRVFHTAAEGLSGEEGEEGKRKFFNNIKGQIDTVNEALNNVEKDLNQSINPPTTLLLRLSELYPYLSSFAITFLSVATWTLILLLNHSLSIQASANPTNGWTRCTKLNLCDVFAENEHFPLL